MPLPIAITMGDAAGIGPEIIARAFARQPDSMRGCFVIGDLQHMRRAASVIAGDSVSLPVAVLGDPSEAWHLPPRCIGVLQVSPGLEAVPFGAVSPQAGAFAGRCIMAAAEAALRYTVAAVVTAPIHKEALSAAGHPYDLYPGHTEMLQAAVAAHLGKPVEAVPVRMMLASPELRTVLVSIHVSLRDAIAAVTFSQVMETLQVTHAALTRMLGRPPRMAVAGLNPHAGEGGLFGREEIEVIGPAIRAARDHGLDVSGPWAPDTVFMRARQAPGHPGEFDAVIAMYHDQGLIPVKYLGVEHGVNVTLGLPFVRTSPDHGTAFDIAGTGTADPSSLLEAISLARQMATS
jgi:4-hydroxythreonine-4-phosphate dehydrogenase